MNIPEMTDEQIFHLWETHVGEPSLKYPYTVVDWTNFARAILAARDAQYAAFDYPIGTPVYTHPAPTNPAAQERAEPVAPAAVEREVRRWRMLAYMVAREIPPHTIIHYIAHPDRLDYTAELHEQYGDLDAAFSATPPPPAKTEASGPTDADWADFGAWAERDKGAMDLLGKLIDVWDDGQLPHEHRCYVEGAWAELIAEARALLSATPPAPAQPSQAKEIKCLGSPGECLFHGDCLYACDRPQPSPEPSKPEQAEAPINHRSRLNAVLSAFGPDADVQFHAVTWEMIHGDITALLATLPPASAAPKLRLTMALDDGDTHTIEVSGTETHLQILDRFIANLQRQIDGVPHPEASAAGDSGAGEREASPAADPAWVALRPEEKQAVAGSRPTGERELFEVWRRDFIERVGDTPLQWEAWQARAALATKPQAEQEAAKKGGV